MAPAPALDLPPPFRLVTLREVGDAMAHATEIAAEEGAGTLVHVGRFDLAEFAVVLEPDEPLWQARRAIYAGSAALADALAVHAPPEKPIAFDWPDAIRVDGGLVGGVRLEWPIGADENEPRAVAGVRRDDPHRRLGEEEPGLHAALRRARGRGLRRSRLRPAGGELRAPSHERDRRLAGQGLWRNREELSGAASHRPRAACAAQIDENGDLLVKRMAATEPVRHSLVSALSRVSWLDPDTGGPRK